MRKVLASSYLLVVVLLILVGIWRTGREDWKEAPLAPPAHKSAAVEVPESEPWAQFRKAPAQLPALSGGYSWEKMLWYGRLMFLTDYSGYERPTEAAAAYGALQTSNPVVEAIVGGDRFWREPALSQKAAASPWTVRAVFRSGVLRRATYAWAMPEIKEAFRKMSAGQQEEYFRILEHAEGYLRTFDHVRETEYFDGLARGRCENVGWRKAHGMELPWWYEGNNCINLFTTLNPEGRESPYRKVETFCFRRFNADGVGPQTQLYWVRRVIADLRTATK